MDTGIDYAHLDFRDPTDPGKSRILAIWDQEDDGPGPTPTDHFLGTLWSQDDIEAAISGTGSIRHRDLDGHGTHVAGSAIGNGAASGGFRGVAPQADIIICAGFDYLLEAMDFIFQQADSLGVPAVVNYSAGSHVGPHDGGSLEEQAIDAMLEERSGRALVTAAGNEGGDFIHWGGFDLEPDSVWTYYHLNVFDPESLSHSEGFFSLSASIDGDFANTHIAVGLDSTAYEDFFVYPRGFHSMTPWSSLQELIDLPSFVTYDLHYRNGKRAASVGFVATLTENGKADLGVFITDHLSHVDTSSPVSAVGADLFRFMARGTASIHVWSESVLSAESRDVDLIVTDSRYRPTDNRFSVGMPAIARKAITVGSWTNTAAGFSDDPGAAPDPGLLVVGTISSFSSRGPTVDGRIKPEIVAPGENVTSSLSCLAIIDDWGVATFGIATDDRLHVMSSGTSFSSPIVAGAVALYLQQNPLATIDEIRNALLTFTREDIFTETHGPLPNNNWGYGKLDVFATITSGQGVTSVDVSVDKISIGGSLTGELEPGDIQDICVFEVAEITDIQILVTSDYDAVLYVYRTDDVTALNVENRLDAQVGFDIESVNLRLSPDSYTIVVSPYSPFSLGYHTVSVSERNIDRRTFNASKGSNTGTLASDTTEDLFIFSVDVQSEFVLGLDPTFDAILGIYRGSAVEDVRLETQIGRVNSSVGVERLIEVLDAGPYLVLVSSFAGSGSYTLNINLETPSNKSPDFNGNGTVDFTDFLLFAAGFGASLGDPKFDSALDLDSDGPIGFSDFLIFALAFGQAVG